VLLGELVVPLLLPAAPPVLLAPALPEVVPLELCSLRHFSFSAPIRLSHLALPVPAAEAPVPAPMLVPLEVVPVPALVLGVELPLVVALGAVPVSPLPVVLPVVLPLVVALGLVVVVVPEPLTPVLLEAPVPVVPVLPALLGAPVPTVELLEVLDLLVAPEPPLSEAQPAPRVASAAAVATASSFIFIACSF
jgi:hypothetical protein